MAQALDKISREFRSAILGADHVLARQLASEYAGALREFWESLPESGRSSSSIPQQASELLNWAHGMTVIQRSLAAEHLAVVQKASRYNAARSDETPSPSVQLRG
jgi:hypothetical protein